MRHSRINTVASTLNRPIGGFEEPTDEGHSDFKLWTKYIYMYIYIR